MDVLNVFSDADSLCYSGKGPISFFAKSINGKVISRSKIHSKVTSGFKREASFNGKTATTRSGKNLLKTLYNFLTRNCKFP